MFCIFIFSFASFIWSQTLCFVSFRHHYHPQRSWGKVIFSVACVKNSVHRGVCRIACWNPPWDQRQTPWDQRQTLPGQEADPPGTRGRPILGADTPWCSACWEIWATSGWYATYWNANLLVDRVGWR